MARKKTTDEFIAEATELHKGKYSYAKTTYTSRWDKVIIGCEVHGDFEQAPANHLQGKGCKRCADTGVICQTLLDRRPDWAQSETHFYYVKLTDNVTEKSFWKVGIAKNLNSRWRTKEHYTVEVLLLVKGTLQYCYDLEQKAVREHKTGVSVDEWPYSGHTEMLNYNFLESGLEPQRG